MSDKWPDNMVPFIREMLPPIEAVTSVEDPTDFGPLVTLPAIYVHLLLSRVEVLEAVVKVADMQAALAWFARAGLAVLANGETEGSA